LLPFVYVLPLAMLSFVISFAVPTPFRQWARLVSGLCLLAAGLLFLESPPALSGLPEVWSKRAAFVGGLLGGGILALLLMEVLTDLGLPPVPMPDGFATSYWESRTRGVGAIVLMVLAAFAGAGVLAGQISLPRALLLAAFAGIAILATTMLIELLRDEPLELESSWGGLGGSLGGWRLSPSAVLLIVAAGFSIAAAAVGASEKPAEPSKKDATSATDDAAKQLANLKREIANLTDEKDSLVQKLSRLSAQAREDANTAELARRTAQGADDAAERARSGAASEREEAGRAASSAEQLRREAEASARAAQTAASAAPDYAKTAKEASNEASAAASGARRSAAEAGDAAASAAASKQAATGSATGAANLEQAGKAFAGRSGELANTAEQAATQAHDYAEAAKASAARGEDSATNLAGIEAKFGGHGALPGRVEALEAVMTCLRSGRPAPPPRSEAELDDAGRRRIQEALGRKGFGPLAPDGQFGLSTIAAKKKFQASLKAAASGELTPEQLALLWTTVTAPATPDFERCLAQPRSATDASAPGRQ
jgi:hypothetical protein